MIRFVNVFRSSSNFSSNCLRRFFYYYESRKFVCCSLNAKVKYCFLVMCYFKAYSITHENFFSASFFQNCDLLEKKNIYIFTVKILQFHVNNILIVDNFALKIKKSERLETVLTNDCHILLRFFSE